MSVFAIQRDLEDYLSGLGLEDTDQYAVRLANLYETSRREMEPEKFLNRMSRLKTVFYKKHRSLERREFENELLHRIDAKHLKKNPGPEEEFPGGVRGERRIVRRSKRRTIGLVLSLFKAATEARAIDAYWLSRTKRRLRDRPESIAQVNLALFATAIMENGGGLVFREFASGVGYVDIGIVFAKTLHLVEIKILDRDRLQGVEQLEEYMRIEGREEGWLVVLDARRRDQQMKHPLPNRIELHRGVVHVVGININPTPPSRIAR